MRSRRTTALTVLISAAPRRGGGAGRRAATGSEPDVHDDLVERRRLDHEARAEQVDLVGRHEGLEPGVVRAGTEEGDARRVGQIAGSAAHDSGFEALVP